MADRKLRLLTALCSFFIFASFIGSTQSGESHPCCLWLCFIRTLSVLNSIKESVTVFLVLNVCVCVCLQRAAAWCTASVRCSADSCWVTPSRPLTLPATSKPSCECCQEAQVKICAEIKNQLNGTVQTKSESTKIKASCVSWLMLKLS